MTDQTTASKSRHGLTLTIIVMAVVLLLVSWGAGQYNSPVVLNEQVNTSWSQMENQYQRRVDLIPSLVETVKGCTSHERETLEGMVNVCAKASQPTIQAGDEVTQEQLNQLQQAQGGLTSALNRLMVVVERYPKFKVDESFRQLQAQLEGTENRITTARMDFNNGAQQYNMKVRRFPTNIFAGLFDFHQRPYFQTEAGAEQTPQMKS